MNIFITGTSSGIGLGLAKHYLIEGHKVFGISRNENEELNKFEHFHFLAQDISDFHYAMIHISNFLMNLKAIDIIILNAGILNNIKDMHHTSAEELQRSMDINVFGNKVALDAAIKMCDVKQVVAISSGAAVSGSRGWNAYAISKAAFKMMIELYSKELPEIHFSSVAPGLVDTKMQKYISRLPEDERFPSISRLKAAKGTSDMPEPDKAAQILVNTFNKAKNYESGAFLDVREM